jgi:hypothetical protein
MSLNQGPDEFKSDPEKALEQQLALWVARHALSSARVNGIHQAVLQQITPNVSPLPLEWWQNFTRSLRSAGNITLNLGSFSELFAITLNAVNATTPR